MSDLRLIITSPCGNHEWQQSAPSIPPRGSAITCRDDNGDILFTGYANHFHTEIRERKHRYEGEPIPDGTYSAKGMVVSIWLDEVPTV